MYFCKVNLKQSKKENYYEKTKYYVNWNVVYDNV